MHAFFHSNRSRLREDHLQQASSRALYHCHHHRAWYRGGRLLYLHSRLPREEEDEEGKEEAEVSRTCAHFKSCPTKTSATSSKSYVRGRRPHTNTPLKNILRSIYACQRDLHKTMLVPDFLRDILVNNDLQCGSVDL